MTKFNTFKQASKSTWGIETEGKLQMTNEQILVGCAQRIADSLENIELIISNLTHENRRLERLNSNLRKKNKMLKNNAVR